ncbi:MAG: hypothetical protein HC927_10595, partial [Deltaproteobacteria bacterium]|nr:hypothetical protein [Deltaproteobacteria bacterium]
MVTPASLYAVPTGSDLLVTGEDLSGEVTGWLATMQPRVSVNYVVRDELIATCTLEVEAPELIIVALRQLDTAGLAWVRQ